jgi:Protein of unknown function (DUF2827)
MKRYKVGITAAYVNDSADQALWSNGIGQNIGYLIMLLQRLACVESVSVVSCPGPEVHPLASAFGVASIPLNDAISQLDLIIELGARALSPEMLDILHGHGGKLVSYVAGNVMVMSFEEIACQTKHGDNVFTRNFDACWVTPQHWHTCQSYLTITRSPLTRIVPHIWDPHCVRTNAINNHARAYWHQPVDNRWGLGCFDPTINVVKTFHYPVLVAEEAYRKAPDLIKTMMLFSTERLKEDQHIQQFIQATDMGSKKLVTAEGRHSVTSVLGKHVHAVITHQWENNLNYLYWDTLFLGWPLIHNSTEFQDVGYYYESFDPQAGGEVLVEAMRTHGETFAKSRRDVFDLLWRFSVDNPLVQKAHTDLIEEVFAS